MEPHLRSPMELHNAVINFTLIFTTLIETTVPHCFLDIIPLCILGIVNSHLSQEEGKKDTLSRFSSITPGRLRNNTFKQATTVFTQTCQSIIYKYPLTVGYKLLISQ